MTFEVLIAPAAKRRIRQQAEWIAAAQAGPRVAAEWLARIYDAIDSLQEMPRLYPVASEDAWCEYEVRLLAIGQFVLLFTIIESEQEIWIVHARHGRQLTRSEDLPRDRDALDDRE